MSAEPAEQEEQYSGVISYADFCRFMETIGYSDPDGNVEDQYLQFTIRDPDDETTKDYPRIVTIDFPVFKDGKHGWPAELLWDFIETQLAQRKKPGTSFRAILNETIKH